MWFETRGTCFRLLKKSTSLVDFLTLSICINFLFTDKIVLILVRQIPFSIYEQHYYTE